MKVGIGHKLVQLGRKLGRMPWLYCRRCGLVALRNEPTRRALAKICDAELPD